jgi:putative transcriptional regulator
MENEIDVKAIRETLGLTQAGLAEQVGVDQSTISNWEKGQAPRGPARKILLSLIAPKPKSRRSAQVPA